MTDNKPYLIRAIYEWIGDNDCTPYLYIDSEADGAKLPNMLIGDNPLVLNISPSACKDLLISNEAIAFQTRFSGMVFDVYLPMDAIIAIVAKENGQGMSFMPVNKETSRATSQTKEQAAENKPGSKTAGKPTGLKVIR